MNQQPMLGKRWLKTLTIGSVKIGSVGLPPPQSIGPNELGVTNAPVSPIPPRMIS
jgi:hypothetical protein